MPPVSDGQTNLSRRSLAKEEGEKQVNVLSLFSGVGGFDMGLENAGMKTVFQCELNKNCQTILQRHWPEVPKWDDVKTLTGEHILQHAPIIDVVAWGSPCQDLSVAGKRAGLEGNQSELFFEGIRIIKELRKATNNVYPRISVWENVFGATHSNKGADFGRVLDEMAEAGALVIEWRVLDAQYFGIPQRRRRVFVVAIFDSATAERCPDPLLPVREGVSWDFTEGQTTWQTFARPTSTGLGDGGQSISDYNRVVGSLAASDWKFRQQQQAHEGKIVIYGVPDPIFFQIHQSGETRIQKNVMHTLAGYMGTGGNNTPMVLTSGLDRAIGFDSTMCMGNANDNVSPPAVCYTPENQLVVRRLTPIECERLMGWPDDHTSGQADMNRYQQCGNGVASPVAQWVGEQLMGIA